MQQPIQAQLRNSLLTALSADDYALLAPHLQRVTLAKGQTIVTPGEPITDVYFPETALGSVVAQSPEGHRAEVMMFGCEGVSGTSLIHDSDCTPHHTLIQIEGEALRLSAGVFPEAMEQSRSLARVMRRYAQTAYIQSTYTALSNANHDVEERLARWLLMCHDRSVGDEMALTHEFLSIMLAVRRPSVTTALHVLEGMLLIRAVRGRVLVRDRLGLEDFAHAAYGLPEAEYTRLVGPMPKAYELAASATRQRANQPQVDWLMRGAGE